MNPFAALLSRLAPSSRFLWLPAVAVLLPSCSLFKKKEGTTSSNGEYVSYPNDGGYHPYNGASGSSGSQRTVASSQSKSSYQEYSSGGGNNDSSGSFESEAPAPKKKTSGSSGSGSSAKKKKKSTGSSNVASSTSSKSSKTKSKSTTTSSKSTGGGRSYVIKSGDTYYGLAKKYHTTVSAIKKANGKSSDLLRDGEKIKIP